MPDFLTLDDISFRGKTVLLRTDLNVPIHDGKVSDATRIERLMPTFTDLIKGGAKIVVLSHFGRPKGKPDAQYSLRPIADELSHILQQPVGFADDCIGQKTAETIKALSPGQVLLLENTRFHAGEESNDPAFVKELAALGDIYVNDAFSCAHRSHASTEGLAHLLPAVAGRLMQAEINALTQALAKPERPVAAIVGGSKISTKLDLLQNLVGKVDILILGGGMANTFLAAKDIAIGKSICEPDMYPTARDIMTTAEKKQCHILLPQDVVVAAELKEGAPAKTVRLKDIPADQMILDLGSTSVQEIKDNLAMCKTIVWNGPLGAFETPPFDRATNEVAIAVADLTKRGKVLSVAGGGDTVSALSNAGVAHGVTYLSTAGGAFLEWLEGKSLPGVVALKNAIPKAKMGKVIM